MHRLTLRYEQQKFSQGFAACIGCDEVGRGSWAGPLVAAAVALRPELVRAVRLRPRVHDSKCLSQRRREQAYTFLTQRLPWAVHVIEPDELDRLGVGEANRRAIAQAAATLRSETSFVVIDGRGFAVNGAHACVVDADAKIFCVAAASIIAKVTRDRLMVHLHERYPQYGFAQHKGYGTPEHAAALRQHGPSPVHRKSFAPVLAMLGNPNGKSVRSTPISSSWGKRRWGGVTADQ